MAGFLEAATSSDVVRGALGSNIWSFLRLRVGYTVRPGAVDGPTVFPEPVQRRGLVDVHGLRMTFYAVPMDNPSAFRGHLVLLWSQHGHTYVYGFHVTGTVEAARALDLEVVHHLEMVAP